MRTFKAIRQELSVENMLKTAHKLAEWERLSGSPQEREAFQYLEGRLREYGYETRLLDCDAYISLPVSCRLTVDGQEIHAQTHSMVPTGHVSAPLLYCGDKAAIRGADCAGKIVLTRGRAVFEPVQAAQQAGAAGIIFIQEAVIRECIPSGCWGSPTTSDWDLLPRIPVASIVDTDGDPLARRLAGGEALTADLTTETDTSWRKIPLLIAELRSPRATDRFVQFTGHLDSWYYGAIDNGTSNALQLEVARIAAAHRESLRRNLRIVYYSGHSHGRYAGSAWYSDHFWEDLYENCVLNINTDCAGCRGADDIAHSIVMPEAKELAVEIVRDQTGERFEGVRCGRLGDQSFWNVGLSSAFASFSRQKKIRLPDGSMGYGRGNAELGPGWHTPDDTVDHIDPANYLRDARIVGEYVMTCLTAPVLPLRFQAAAADIAGILKSWQEKAGGAFDLSRPIALAEELEQLCGAFDQAELPEERAETAMLQLSRLLVPLNFTRGNIYGTEPAMAVDPMPSLSPIKRLVAQGTSQRDQMALRLELTRASNYINHTLRQAIRLLRETMSV